MARPTRLPVDAFERGRGPEICFLSGEPTEDRVNTRVETPDSYLWLIFFGFLPYLVVRILTRRTASGSLPLSEHVYLEIKARRIDRRLPPALFVGGLVAGALLVGRVPALGLALMVGGLVGGVALAIIARRRDPLTGLSLVDGGRWVLIPNAADAYADALAADLRAGHL